MVSETREIEVLVTEELSVAIARGKEKKIELDQEKKILVGAKYCSDTIKKFYHTGDLKV